MSNPLSVRRVIVQTVDENGVPEGEPTFGVMVADDCESDYNDTFESLKALNDAITEAGCILDMVDTSKFPDANREVIGTNNYYGKDWQRDEG